MGTIFCLRHPDRETVQHPCVWVELDGRPVEQNICVCCDECMDTCATKEPKADWPPLEPSGGG